MGGKETSGCGARGQRKGRMRRVSKREQCGAVKTMEGWWERPDGGARWRDDGRELRRRGAHTAAKIRAADHFWAFLRNTVGVPRRHS